MKKRGELTSSQIATLTLTIFAFVIAVIFLLLILDLDEFSERETCHLSVLTRATTPDPLEKLAPLKCRTQKICLTKGEGCDDKFVGEENVREIIVETNEDVEKEVAYNMYDCWAMMGEGKLDVFGGRKAGFINNWDFGKTFNTQASTCLICSRIALADDVIKDSKIYDNIDVNKYMENHQVPGSELTYLQMFTDQQVRSYPADMRNELKSDENVKKTDEIAIIFMQILTDVTPWESATTSGLEAGGFIFGATKVVGPLGRILSWKFTTLLTLGATTATGTIAGIQTWRSRQVSAGYCQDFIRGDDAEKGCSLVTPFDYNRIDKINEFCGSLEGQP